MKCCGVPSRIELQLAVLIDGTERGPQGSCPRRSCQGSHPELDVPGGEARQPVAIGQHDVGAHAAFLGQADGHGSPDSRVEVCGFPSIEELLHHRPCAFAQGTARSSTRASAGRRPTLAQTGKAAANPGVMLQHRNLEGITERTEAISLAPVVAGSVRPRKRSGTEVGPYPAKGGHCHAQLRQRLGRVPRFRGD